MTMYSVCCMAYRHGLLRHDTVYIVATLQTGQQLYLPAKPHSVVTMKTTVLIFTAMKAQYFSF